MLFSPSVVEIWELEHLSIPLPLDLPGRCGAVEDRRAVPRHHGVLGLDLEAEIPEVARGSCKKKRESIKN